MTEELQETLRNVQHNISLMTVVDPQLSKSVQTLASILQEVLVILNPMIVQNGFVRIDMNKV